MGAIFRQSYHGLVQYCEKVTKPAGTPQNKQGPLKTSRDSLKQAGTPQNKQGPLKTSRERVPPRKDAVRPLMFPYHVSIPRDGWMCTLASTGRDDGYILHHLAY